MHYKTQLLNSSAHDEKYPTTTTSSSRPHGDCLWPRGRGQRSGHGRGCDHARPRRRDVHAAHVELGGEGARPLVEGQREAPVHQVVVVDGGEARAQTQLRPLVAQVHGRRQRQVVVPGRVVRVLQRGQRVRGQSVGGEL